MDRLKEEIARLKTLSTLINELRKLEETGTDKELKILKTKLQVTKEEMLKSTYSIGKILKSIEEKV